MTLIILPPSGEVPGQRCYSSRRNRRKHILHHPQRRGTFMVYYFVPKLISKCVSVLHQPGRTLYT